MKGIIFNLLEETVAHEFGEAAWDELLEASHLEGVYTSLGSYPDAELMKLIAAVASRRKTPADAAVRWFGARALPLLAARYPIFFQEPRCARSFLLTLNDIIHPEVRKVYPGADVPEFTYDTSSEQELVMIYQSPRKLCALAEGLIQGAADHYGEVAVLKHVKCMNRGDDRCVLQISFHKREAEHDA